MGTNQRCSRLGAIDHVSPEEIASHVPVKETEMSKRGMYYTTADGTPVVNKGEKTLYGISEDGTPMKIPVQVAGVNRTLFSVRRIEEAGI